MSGSSLKLNDQQALVRDFVMGAGKDYSVLIVSYELFRKHTAALAQLTNLMLICDEGQGHAACTSGRKSSWTRVW